MIDTILYIRVSSEDQNPERQIEALKSWATETGSGATKTIIEKVSGSVPAKEREFAQVFEIEGIKRVVVQDLDRLGRDTLDILQTIKELTEKNINVTITRLGASSLNPDGTENPVFKIITSVMATLAEIERKKIKERQKQGISIAVAKGKFQGRQAGATKKIEKYKKEYRGLIVAIKTKGGSLRDLAKITGVSPNTVKKVKKLVEAGTL